LKHGLRNRCELGLPNSHGCSKFMTKSPSADGTDNK
jgi:hypothetical protein